MESYEEFCLQSLDRLKTEGRTRRTGIQPVASLEKVSVLCFHGQPVLAPLLSEERRGEMMTYKQRALQLEVELQSRQKSSVLAMVQGILDRVEQVQKLTEKEKEKMPPTPPFCLSPKPELVNSYTLVTDSPGLPRHDGVQGNMADLNATPHTEPPSLLNGYRAEKGAREEEEGESWRTKEDIKEGVLSLESLLKKSKEHAEREQNTRGSKVNIVNRVTWTPPPENLSDKENESRSPLGEMSMGLGYSLHHSPLAPPQTQYETCSLPRSCRAGCLSPSLADPYVFLPRPEPSLSPKPQRRRPRPVSAGNIHISFPIGPADLIPRSPGRSGEFQGIAAWGEAYSGGMRSPDHWGSVGNGSGSSRRSSHCGTSPVQEASSPVSTPGTGSLGHHDILGSGQRRRCHTMDSQQQPSHSRSIGSPHIDRSQERAPRFVGGVARFAPSRQTPAAPLNQSYEVESPSSSLLRSHVTSDLAPGCVILQLENKAPKGPSNGRIATTALSKAIEQQDSRTEETQLHVHSLEDMQRRLAEEHALQMSLLLVEQEKEQQRLRQELEDKERRLREEGCDGPMGGVAGGRVRRSACESYPALSPSCPGLSPAHSPAEHKTGLPSPLCSRVSSPSAQSPVYLWGLNSGASKPRGRLCQVLSLEQQRALCRLSAIFRGSLTRKLLKTEKVKHLRQTVLDTQDFIRSFQTETPQKRESISPQDFCLQERVRAQLRAALYDIHDIFFEISLEERLALLQQDRELRAERKLREMEKARSPKERVVLSAATQRSLDRKKRVGASAGQPRRMQHKPKNPTPNRILKPSPGQNSPVSDQLNRQGSWYRKTPEERVRRSDGLKKQHSLS